MIIHSYNYLVMVPPTLLQMEELSQLTVHDMSACDIEPDLLHALLEAVEASVRRGHGAGSGSSSADVGSSNSRQATDGSSRKQGAASTLPRLLQEHGLIKLLPMVGPTTPS